MDTPSHHEPDVPGWLSGLHLTMVGVLALMPLVMLATGVATGYWPVALASLPALAFVLSVSQAILYRRRAYHVALTGRGDPAGAGPYYRRAALWAAVALLACVATVAVVDIPA